MIATPDPDLEGLLCEADCFLIALEAIASNMAMTSDIGCGISVITTEIRSRVRQARDMIEQGLVPS